jgi:hypothetical protein
MAAERERVAGFGRLEDGLRQAGDWYRWGPYVSERQWGTVREDYSADGEAWDYLPHDHARSRAYRWGEDGLAGFCDIEQRLCLGLALWNGRDPILKERAFGLTGAQGNHGEDVKEYWWYLDAVPSHAWNRWRYHYPQAAYPYQDLIDQNAARNRTQPEYELVDTGVFDSGRYWIVEVHYAKADPDDLLMKVSVTNSGPDTDSLHVLPTAWFRNTWSWDSDTPRPRMGAMDDNAVEIEHPWLGSLELLAGHLRSCFSKTSRISNACTAWSRLRHIPRMASTITSSAGRRRSIPIAAAPSAPIGTRSPSSLARRSSCGCGCGRSRKRRVAEQSTRSAPGSTG